MKLKISYKIFLVMMLVQLSAYKANSQKFSKDLPSFTKIMVSNRVNLVIQEGKNHHIEGVVRNVPLDELVIKVKNDRLLIYLNEARYYEKNKKDKSQGYKRKVSYYDNNVKVNVVVSCDILEKLEVRGEQDVNCDKVIDLEKFKLIAYGEADIVFKSLKAKKLKARIYGESDVDILDGDIKSQIYHTYGENRVDIKHVSNKQTKIISFGENDFALSSNSMVKINSIGANGIITQ